jgi:hypothetical protein
VITLRAILLGPSALAPDEEHAGMSEVGRSFRISGRATL